MKKCLLWGLLTGLSISTLYAQEAIYLANGNRSAGKLTGAEGEKVKITVIRNGKPAYYSLRRENVLLAFSDDGRYLIVNSLDTDPAKAQQEIDAFQKGAAAHPDFDLLVKASPPTVLQGTIRYESGDVVNYQSAGGASGSINKRELAIIFYRDGRHQLLMPPAEVVSLLNSTRSELIRLATPAPVVPPTATAKKMPKLPPSSAKVAKKLPAKSEAAPKNTQPANPTTAPSVPVTPVPSAASEPSAIAKPKLSDAQYQQYRSSALSRVDEFVAYLNIIANKELTDDEKDKAIEQVVKLFLPEATIDVSSANRPGVRKYKIKDYLTRLKMVPYASSTIDWTEIQYVSELKQAADGNYYGLITGQQTFTGYAENGQDVLYTDVTEKSVQVKLEAYRSLKDGNTQLKWAVLLGNIGIVVK
ncbi:hypothetical protein GO730_28430 [Spirosoma sp. HMF3257]|uniref:SLA1 homology domain-containing protein n=1 Tax=Spirosoma telluris TaxID=2183553 RepID=A0A327NPM5_9BACT|nr:hypothetical protein [Spirosoma telluris]RAI77127.1 hypothetical protein HMF3257_28370 [Spirosoma telluris]